MLAWALAISRTAAARGVIPGSSSANSAGTGGASATVELIWKTLQRYRTLRALCQEGVQREDDASGGNVDLVAHLELPFKPNRRGKPCAEPWAEPPRG